MKCQCGLATRKLSVCLSLVSEMTYYVSSGHRPRKVLKVGGQTGVKTKAVLGVSRGGGRLPQRGFGVSPQENFENVICKMGHFVAKLHFVLIISKLQF